MIKFYGVTIELLRSAGLIATSTHPLTQMCITASNGLQHELYLCTDVTKDLQAERNPIGSL